MKISELFFKFIKDKHLGRKGVTGEILAHALAEAGFLIPTKQDEFVWTVKALRGEHAKEFWKVIDSCKPT